MQCLLITNTFFDTLIIANTFFYFLLTKPPQDNGERQENFFLICSSDGSYIWLLISFIYKGCLQVLAIFMAFHTRKVKIKALNDSKEIMAIIYINSIILALLTVTEFALKSYNDAYAALFGLSLLIEATLFLGLVFVPKV